MIGSSDGDFGRRMEDFRLPEVQSGALTSLSGILAPDPTLRGIVVVFWSSVCSHCRRYDAYLSSFADDHPELALAAIAARQTEDLSGLGRAVTERQLRFSILHDADLAVADSWRVEQTPRVFLLDRELRLLYRGAIDNFKYPQDPEHVPYLEAAMADLLAGRPIARPESPSFGCPTRSVYFDLAAPRGSKSTGSRNAGSKKADP